MTSSSMPLSVALFFSYGMSIKGWSEAGLALRDSLLYRRLVEHGCAVTFVTYGDADDHEYLPGGVSVQVLTKPPGMSRQKYGRRISSLHREALSRVQVIKSHQVAGARYAVLSKLLLRKPYIARCGYLGTVFAAEQEPSLRRRIKTRAEEFLAFRAADAVCVPSEAEVEYIVKRHGVRRERTHACPNWVDVDGFKPEPGIQRHLRRVCFIGRFEPQKDPLVFLEAVKDIPDVELLMIGGGSLRHEIDARIDEYGLRATVLDRVSNEDLPAHLNGAALYVLPTRYEGGSPKTLFEAMACELPVVSTNAFGANEAFEDGAHGVKCDPGDVRAFRDGITSLLDNPDRARECGAAGRRHIIANFSVERAVERELAILGRLVGVSDTTVF